MSKRIDTRALRMAVLRMIDSNPGCDCSDIESDPVVRAQRELLPRKPDEYRYINQALQYLRRRNGGLIEHRRKAAGNVVQRAGWYVTKEGRAAL